VHRQGTKQLLLEVSLVVVLAGDLLHVLIDETVTVGVVVELIRVTRVELIHGAARESIIEKQSCYHKRGRRRIREEEKEDGEGGGWDRRVLAREVRGRMGLSASCEAVSSMIRKRLKGSAVLFIKSFWHTMRYSQFALTGIGS